MMTNHAAYADQIAYLIEHIQTPIADRRTQLHELQLQIADLEAQGICNGTEYWRDANTNQPRPKLYVNHSIDKSCPLHGQPKPNRRIRHYVGIKQDKQAEAKAAIERHKQHRTLLAEQQGLERAISSALDTLQDFYSTLGYTVPPFPADQPPAPNHHWNPGAHYSRHRRW